MVTDDLVDVMEFLINVTTSITAQDALTMALDMLKAWSPEEWKTMTQEEREEWISNYAFV